MSEFKLVEFTQINDIKSSVNPLYVSCVKEEITNNGTLTLVYINGKDGAVIITYESFNDVLNKLRGDFIK